MKTPNSSQPRPRFPVLAAAALAILLPGVLLSQERDHEGGFFLRLSAGGGGASTEAKDAGYTFKFSGPAGDVNFAIHGTLFGWSITDPDIEFGGTTGNGKGDLTLGAFGGGVTYYFMPANLYLSGSLGVGKLEYKQGNLSGRSSSGIVFDATIGKEWWTGDTWGLGVALGLGMHSIPEQGVDDNWAGGSVTVRFTATMN